MPVLKVHKVSLGNPTKFTRPRLIHTVSLTHQENRETYISDSAESPDGRASVHIFLSCHVLGQTKKNQVSYMGSFKVFSFVESTPS